MIQLPLKDIEIDFCGLVSLNLAHKDFRGLCQIVHEFDVRYSQRLASSIGCGGIVCVRCQLDHFVRLESEPLQPDENHVLELGSHGQDIEAEDETALLQAFQQNDRDFDRVEDCRDRGGARGIACQPDLTVSRGHVA